MENSLQPYPIKRSDSIYSFITEDGIEYNVTFVSSCFTTNATFNENVFMLALTKVSSHQKKSAQDNRISATVVEILKDFLSSQNSAIVYICDGMDGKQRLRNRKFNFWYSKYADSKVYYKDSMEIAFDTPVPNVCCFSIILKTQNPFFEEITTTFTELGLDFNKHE